MNNEGLTLEQMIDNYAELAVTKGVNIQPNQQLVVNAPVECADFARTVVKKAYEAGSGYVTVIWNDDQIQRLTYEYNETSFFEQVPAWKREQLNSLAEEGAAFLHLFGEDPSVLAGIDPEKPATAARVRNKAFDKYRHGLDFGINTWSIVGVPTKAWATTVFPDLDAGEAVRRLWYAILETARSNGENPAAVWDAHNATFEHHKTLLNDCQFDHLHYTSSNGTDLTVGLNKGHVWEGGSATVANGTVYFPNMPTEEVFTTPDRLRVDGIVYSVIPLVHAGSIIRDFWIRFENGCAVEFGAEEGEEVLRQIIETDENSCRLGECALVAKDTPIRESGLLFYNTLYDENASCHLALGQGFPGCREGGLEMEKAELIEHGVNFSHTHVDFMIGANDMNIVGVKSDGEEIPIFEDGVWAPYFC
jgi:aminopeptidase